MKQGSFFSKFVVKSAWTKALVAVVLVCLFSSASFAASVASRRYAKSKAQVAESAAAQKRIARSKHSRATATTTVARKGKRKARATRYYEHFSASSFVENDQTRGDLTAGEDVMVRQAALEALGNMNGTIVAIDPSSGRILAMVNQQLALSEGAQPCSTIKVSVALAALSEGLINKDTKVSLNRSWKMDLTQALAHSNNAYFEALGRRLGFEKVRHYANQFGLGELAGWNIEGEHLGVYPSQELSAKLGGVGKMCSFGESVSMTPLQLGALVSSIANGGTLYYLQHPTSPEEVANFQPKVKRYLDIAPLIPEVMPGHGWRRAVRHSAQNAGEFQRGRDSRQDGNMLQGRHTVRMVRLLREHGLRKSCYGGVPAWWSSNVRPQGGGSCRTHVSRHV